MDDERNVERVAELRRVAGDPLWWRPLGECSRRKADLSLFITEGDRDDDPWYPNPEALKYCNFCTVRVHCLNWALTNKEHGTWGGTSEYQRRQLRRTQSRATCPACGAHDITIVKDYEICLSCGTSWPVLGGVDRTEATG